MSRVVHDLRPLCPIGDSLQDFAARVGGDIRYAYPMWHRAGPLAAHIIVAGDNALGLLPTDIRNIERGIY